MRVKVFFQVLVEVRGLRHNHNYLRNSLRLPARSKGRHETTGVCDILFQVFYAQNKHLFEYEDAA